MSSVKNKNKEMNSKISEKSKSKVEYDNNKSVKIGKTTINYKTIITTNDYIDLKEQIEHIMNENDKDGCLLDVENALNQAQEDKERSLYINFPLATAFGFGVLGLFIGVFIKAELGILFYVGACIAAIAIYGVILKMLVDKSNNSLEKINYRIAFLNKIYRIINETIKNAQ